MAPFLEQGGSIPEGAHKFVRDGDRVAYDDMQKSHFEIAEEHGLGEVPARMVRDRQTRLVDDSGHIASKPSGVQSVGGKGTTVEHRHISGQNQRQITLDLISKRTGKETVNVIL